MISMKTLQKTEDAPKYKVHPAQVPVVLLGLPLGLLGEWYQGIITGFEGERLRGDGPTLNMTVATTKSRANSNP